MDETNNGYRGTITGSETYEDGGKTYLSVSVLVTCPDGTTYGYFAATPDAARVAFYERTAS